MVTVAVGCVSSKGQVTIPKEAREALGIHSGDKVLFDIEKDKIVLHKAEEHSLRDILSRLDIKENATRFQRRLRREWSHRSP